MVLPILTFDEHALSPRFGYVFDPAWLESHESILGMLWKFMRANRPPATMPAQQPMATAGCGWRAASASAVRHSGNRCHRLSSESYDVGADLGNQIITRSVRWLSIFRSTPSSLGVR